MKTVCYENASSNGNGNLAGLGIVGGIALAEPTPIGEIVLLGLLGTAVLMSGEWKKGQLYDPTLDNFLNGYRKMDPLKPKPPGDPGKWGKAGKWGVAGWLTIEAINKANQFIDYLTQPMPSPTPPPKTPELRKR